MQEGMFPESEKAGGRSGPAAASSFCVNVYGPVATRITRNQEPEIPDKIKGFSHRILCSTLFFEGFLESLPGAVLLVLRVILPLFDNCPLARRFHSFPLGLG